MAFDHNKLWRPPSANSFTVTSRMLCALVTAKCVGLRLREPVLWDEMVTYFMAKGNKYYSILASCWKPLAKDNAKNSLGLNIDIEKKNLPFHQKNWTFGRHLEFQNDCHLVITEKAFALASISYVVSHLC